MKIGILSVDSTYPNLALMKISAFCKYGRRNRSLYKRRRQSDDCKNKAIHDSLWISRYKDAYASH